MKTVLASITCCLFFSSAVPSRVQAVTPPKDPVPVLVGQLSDDRRGDAAAEALGGIVPSEQSRQLLRSCLKSANQAERGRAALVLGQWHDFQSAPGIEELLSNNDVTVRKDAITGYSVLYQQAPERYDVKLLEKFIRTETDFENLRTAVDRLASTAGKETDEALLRIMKSEKNNKVLCRTLYDVGKRGKTMMTLPVLNIVQANDDPDVRAAGFYAFGKFHDEEAEPYITRIMHSAKKMNAEMKLQAYEALTSIGRPVDFKDYLVHLYDTDGCDECYSFKDALLGLVAANVKPGDKETLAFLVSFKKVAAARFQEQIGSIIKKIGQ